MPPKRPHPEGSATPGATSGGVSTATDPSILLKRRQDRAKANEKLQLRLDEQGIRRTEVENNLAFTSIPQALLVNQKNYYTEYLKKDDNLRVVRTIREKIVRNGALTKSKSHSSGGSHANPTIAGLKKNGNGSGSANVTESEDVADDDENGTADVEDGESEDERTLVIHPGTHSIKIGWAEDVDPVVIPNLVAYARRAPAGTATVPIKKKDRFDVEGLDPPRILIKEGGESKGEKGDEAANDTENGTVSGSGSSSSNANVESEDYFMLADDKTFRAKRKQIAQSYRERMKYYKRRLLPNCHEACFNFNRRQQRQLPPAERIGDDFGGPVEVEPEKNMFIDAGRWKAEVGRDWLVGEEVLRLKNEKDWIIRSPFMFASVSEDVSEESNVEQGFNELDINYSSREEILGDIELIISHVLKTKFEVKSRGDFEKLNVVLIAPSLYRKAYVESMVELLVSKFEFKSFACIQEGISASFGLGVSTGCIVDIGANTTHICCVDDGVVLEDTRITLDYGVADAVRFWGKSLVAQQFSKPDIDLQKLKDWKLMENLFADHCTFDDSKTGVIQVGNFTVQISNSKMRRYQFKCFDENMISPMGLFYPDMFMENFETVEKRITFSSLSPPKVVRKGGPLLEGLSYKWTGYRNDDPVSILQELQRNGVALADMDLEDTLYVLVEISEAISNTGGMNYSEKRAKVAEVMEKIKHKVKKSGTEAATAKNRGTNAMRRNMTPLDRAIIESITISGLGDQSRLEKMYANICLVGGGAKIEGFDSILTDRIHLNRSDVLGSGNLVAAIAAMRIQMQEHTRAEEAEVKRAIEQRERELQEQREREREEEEKAKENGKEKDPHSHRFKPAPPPVKLPERPYVRFSLGSEQTQTLGELLVQGTPMSVDITGGGRGENEIDPASLAWKGGCVYARLKLADEMWMGASDWDLLGARALIYGSVFPY
jgi:actin-related protein 8